MRYCRENIDFRKDSRYNAGDVVTIIPDFSDSYSYTISHNSTMTRTRGLKGRIIRVSNGNSPDRVHYSIEVSGMSLTGYVFTSDMFLESYKKAPKIVPYSLLKLRCGKFAYCLDGEIIREYYSHKDFLEVSDYVEYSHANIRSMDIVEYEVMKEEEIDVYLKHGINLDNFYFSGGK